MARRGRKRNPVEEILSEAAAKNAQHTEMMEAIEVRRHPGTDLEFIEPEADFAEFVTSKRKVATPRLRNAQLMADRFGTFKVPSDKQLDAIKEGDVVRLCTTRGVRFWTQVDRVGADYIYGIVANNLPVEDEIGLGDRIKFKQQHVYQVRKGRKNGKKKK